MTTMTDEEVLTGVMYSYVYQDEERMAVLELITKPIKGIRWCRFDNSDQMTLDDFKQTATRIDESSNIPKVENQPAPKSPDQTAQKEVNKLTNPKVDNDGNPILQSNEEIPVVSPEQYKENQRKNDPVIALLKKANTQEIILSIDLPVQLIDKKLFGVVVESFGEESKETIYKFIMDSISPEQFKEDTIKMIEKHYNDQTES